MVRAVFFILMCLFIASSVSHAQTAAPLDLAAKQAVLIEEATGTTLYAKGADDQMPTSSMSKMMTVYMVFDALKQGKIHMDDRLPVSEKAWKQEGSRMFLNLGEQARVDDLLRGIIIQSGNDATVVVAEALGQGAESTFATMMNERAKELGLTNSHFTNAAGLPDPQHYSTPRDLALLAQSLIHNYPEHYHFFSEKEFTYNKITQGNRNPLLYRNIGVDGLKTGHTDIGGFGLTGSAIRDGRRLIFVINGTKDMQARADVSANLLEWGYREFGLYTVTKAGAEIARAKTWLGLSPDVGVAVAKDVVVSLPRAASTTLKAHYSFQQPIEAPVTKGQVVGQVTITASGMETQTVPLVAMQDVERQGFFARIATKLKALLHGSP